MAQVTQQGKEAHVAQGEEEEELLFPNHNKNTEKSLTELPLPASSESTDLNFLIYIN